MPNHLAIYIRLSMADSKRNPNQIQDESESISGQRALAHSFLDNHPEFADWTVHEYVDDGYTGTNDNRPQFQQMMKDVRDRKLSLIIVKDFSRFARDYIMMGDYLEQIFPFLGVRFISINDQYDSAQNTDFSDSITVVLKSIMNSYYSRELSAKMVSCFRQRMYADDYHGRPSFGYIYGTDHKSIVIDPVAGKIVRQIFELAMQGILPVQIARILNEEGIPTPRQYALGQEKLKGSNKIYWSTSKVAYILHSQTYVGDLIMHRSERVAPCSKKERKLDPSEYIVRENDHPGIVTREEFALVQEILPKKQRSAPAPNRTYVMKGKLRCGGCGRMLDYYDRSERVLCPNSRVTQSPCFNTEYQIPVVYPSVLSTTKAALSLILKEEAASAKRKAQAPDVIKKINADLQTAQSEKQKLLFKKAELYERYIAGGIPVIQYLEKKNALSQQSSEIDSRIAALNAEKDSYAYINISTDMRTVSQAARKFSGAEKLTTEIVDTLIKAVYLYHDGLKIEWKHQALFERFAPEFTNKVPYINEQEER